MPREGRIEREPSGRPASEEPGAAAVLARDVSAHQCTSTAVERRGYLRFCSDGAIVDDAREFPDIGDSPVTMPREALIVKLRDKAKNRQSAPLTVRRLASTATGAIIVGAALSRWAV